MWSFDFFEPNILSYLLVLERVLQNFSPKWVKQGRVLFFQPLRAGPAVRIATTCQEAIQFLPTCSDSKARKTVRSVSWPPAMVSSLPHCPHMCARSSSSPMKSGIEKGAAAQRSACVSPGMDTETHRVLPDLHPGCLRLGPVSHLLPTSLPHSTAFSQVSEVQQVQFSHFTSPFAIAQFRIITSLILKDGISGLATRPYILSYETYCGEVWTQAHEDWQISQIPITGDRAASSTSAPKGVGLISQSVLIRKLGEAHLEMQAPRPEHRCMVLGFQEWNLYLVFIRSPPGIPDTNTCGEWVLWRSCKSWEHEVNMLCWWNRPNILLQLLTF